MSPWPCSPGQRQFQGNLVEGRAKSSQQLPPSPPPNDGLLQGQAQLKTVLKAEWQPQTEPLCTVQSIKGGPQLDWNVTESQKPITQAHLRYTAVEGHFECDNYFTTPTTSLTCNSLTSYIVNLTNTVIIQSQASVCTHQSLTSCLSHRESTWISHDIIHSDI